MAADKLLLLALLAIQGTVVFGQSGAAKCLPPTDAGDEFSFLFRFKPAGGNTVTQIAFYNASEAPTETSTVINSPAQCVDTTADANGVWELSFSVDGDAASLPCGIARSGNEYKLIFAIDGTQDRAYEVTCIVGTNLNNFPTFLNITTFETGNLVDTLIHRENPKDICLQLLHADGNRIPVLFARLGEMLRVRAILDKEHKGNVPDTWFTKFHIPILEHSGAEVYLQVVTRDFGTAVKVTGILPGNEFTKYARVFRDEETLITIPKAYIHGSSSSNSWTKSLRAVTVEVPPFAQCGEIAVKLVSKQPDNSRAGSFIALPDDVLGTKYNAYTGSTGQNSGRVLVYGIEASTVITVDFNAFPIAGINISGTPITTTTNVNLQENQVVNLRCGSDCGLLQITSNKPVGVIAGHENAKIETADAATDHYVSQLFPVSTYGDSYVLLPGSLFASSVQYQIILEDPTTTVNYTRNSGTTTNVASGTYIDDVTSAEEFSFTRKIMLMMTSNATTPFTMPYPAHHQWAIQHYFFVVPGESYSVVVVARIGTLAKIEYRDYYAITDAGTTTTLGAIAMFSTTNVNPLSGGTAKYEYFTRTISAQSNRGPVLIELKSGVRNSPFLFMVQPVISSNKNIQYMSIGTRLPTVNPCVPSPVLNTPFVSTNYSQPGDGIDNDCDGLIDEEFSDNKDSDGTGQIDEDLAFNYIYPELGIYVDYLYFSNNAQFSNAGNGITITLIADGCATRTSGALGQVQPLSWTPDVGPMFDTFHVVTSPAFGAFYIYEPPLYIRAEIRFCNGKDISDSRCNMSCLVTTPGRKRRQDGNFVTVDTKLNFLPNTTGNQTHGVFRNEPCTMDKLYWIPALLVLSTILIEAVMVGTFLLYRGPAKRYL